MTTPEERPPGSTRKRITLEALEKFATLVGVCLGIAAFAWQVSDAIHDRRERVVIQAGGYYGLAPDDPIDIFDRKRMWVEVTNTGRQPVFVREVHIVIQAADDNGPFHSALRAFDPDSGAFEIEPGSFKRFGSPWRSGRDGRAMENGTYTVRVMTTKTSYEKSGQSVDLPWSMRAFTPAAEP